MSMLTFLAGEGACRIFVGRTLLLRWNRDRRRVGAPWPVGRNGRSVRPTGGPASVDAGDRPHEVLVVEASPGESTGRTKSVQTACRAAGSILERGGLDGRDDRLDDRVVDAGEVEIVADASRSVALVEAVFGHAPGIGLVVDQPECIEIADDGCGRTAAVTRRDRASEIGLGCLNGGREAVPPSSVHRDGRLTPRDPGSPPRRGTGRARCRVGGHRPRRRPASIRHRT